MTENSQVERYSFGFAELLRFNILGSEMQNWTIGTKTKFIFMEYLLHF